MTNKFIQYFKEESRVPGKGSYFASLTVNIILLYVVNNLRYMGITQLTEKNLISCLWAINIIFGLAIIGNFTLILYRPAWFHHLIQTLINAAGVNAFFFIYKLYPFNLGSTTLDNIIKVVLILIMIGFFAAFLLEFYRFGINVNFPKKKPIVDVIPGDADSSNIPDESLTISQSPSSNPEDSPTTPSETTDPPSCADQTSSLDPVQNNPETVSKPEQPSNPPTQ